MSLEQMRRACIIKERKLPWDGASTSMASAEGGFGTGIAMAGTFLGLS